MSSDANADRPPPEVSTGVHRWSPSPPYVSSMGRNDPPQERLMQDARWRLATESRWPLGCDGAFPWGGRHLGEPVSNEAGLEETDLGPLAWQHYTEPHGAAGEWLDGDYVATGAAGAMADGVRVVIQLRRTENELIDAVRWQAMGPPEVIAASSWLATILPGSAVAAASEWNALALVQALELPAHATSNVLVVEDALANALAPMASACGSENY